jgi:orotidine-5'-phosphate decarboxylase
VAELVTALDFPNVTAAESTAQELAGVVPWVKIGLELFTASGPHACKRMKDMGFKVFLDLKLLDIPNTVAGAVASASDMGVDMLTLHTMGGKRMLQAAADAKHAANSELLLMGVTVLTSMEAEDFPFPIPGGVSEMVTMLADSAKESGLDGVVCSGHEAAAVKARQGNEFLALTPGIRLEQSFDDQRRTMAPHEAVSAGSDFLVMGRPIIKAESPRSAAIHVLEQMLKGALE